MYIHFLKEDALTALKTNISGNIKHYSEPTNQWIFDFFEGDNPFDVLKVQVEDFRLVEEPDDIIQHDAENAIILYSAMKNLSDTQATDERIWAGLAHSDLWEYMQKRWQKSNTTYSSNSQIESRYFLNKRNSSKRSLFINTISKMWWTARLTYDQNRKDPFELTRYFSENFSTKVVPIFSSNFMGNPTVARGLISALVELEQNGFFLRKNWFTLATNYLNILGGTHILDYYSEEETKEKVLKYMWSLSSESTNKNL